VRSFIAKGQRQSQLEATSGCSSVVVLQHVTESFAARDLTSDGTNILIRLDELVAQALMISLAMIMLDVFAHSSLE
jgi:hypothetical protein